MKGLIAAALMIVSFSSFGSELNSIDSLLSVLPLGVHRGETPEKANCMVAVTEVDFPTKAVIVTISDKTNRIFKVVSEGSDFLFRAYKKEFIQTERFYVDSTRNSYVDRVIRTVIAGENLLYVIVANEVTVNRDRKVESLECIVNL